MKRYWKWFVLFAFAVGFAFLDVFFMNEEGFIYVSLIGKLKLAPFYVLLAAASLHLRKRFFTNRQYPSYILSMLLLILAASLLAEYWSPYRAPDFVRDISLEAHVLGILFLMILAAYLQSVREFIGKRYELQEYRFQKMQAELQLLKRQLNPHFLFNTLNSIYSKATRQSQEVADMVLNLSDLLRHQLKTDTSDMVPLQDEAEFLQHYIFFEKRRLPHNMTVDFRVNIDMPAIPIAPNILITLVENAFKHGVVTQEAAVISINLNEEGRALTLQTINPIANAELKRSGTGIENLKKRLDFLYPNRFTLTLKKNVHTYEAILKIQL